MDSDSDDCHTNRNAMGTYCRISTPKMAWVCFFVPFLGDTRVLATGGEGR